MAEKKVDIDELQDKAKSLANLLEQKVQQAHQAKSLTPADIEAQLKEAADKFTDDNINRPAAQDYLLVHSAMLMGWEMGVRHSIKHMRENGIVLG